MLAGLNFRSCRSIAHPFSSLKQVTMSVKATFGFSSTQYREKQESVSEHDLKKKHHVKVQRIVMTTGSAIGARAAAPYTFGATLVVYLYLLRQKRILERQKNLIEEMLLERGEVKPRVRMRDLVAGATVAIVSAPVTALSGVPLMENVVHAVGAAGATAIAKHSSKKKRTNIIGTVEAEVDDTIRAEKKEDENKHLKGIVEVDDPKMPVTPPSIEATQEQKSATPEDKPDVETNRPTEEGKKEMKGDGDDAVIEVTDRAVEKGQTTDAIPEGAVKKEKKEHIYQKMIEDYQFQASHPTDRQLEPILQPERKYADSLPAADSEKVLPQVPPNEKRMSARANELWDNFVEHGIPATQRAANTAGTVTAKYATIAGKATAKHATTGGKFTAKHTVKASRYTSEKTTEGWKKGRAAIDEWNTERKKRKGHERGEEMNGGTQNVIVLDAAKDEKVDADDIAVSRNPLDALPELAK
jgi:hypothetical protein